MQGDPFIHISDVEDEFDRILGVCTSGLVVARIDNNLEKEEEEMTPNQKKGLRDLLADKVKGLTPKDALGSQPLPALPQSKEEREREGESRGRGGGPPKGTEATKDGQGLSAGLPVQEYGGPGCGRGVPSKPRLGPLVGARRGSHPRELHH